MGKSDERVEGLYRREFVSPKSQTKDTYWENGKMVMTEEYHKKRGYCCGNNCKHCPYQPKHIQNNKTLT